MSHQWVSGPCIQLTTTLHWYRPDESNRPFSNSVAKPSPIYTSGDWRRPCQPVPSAPTSTRLVARGGPALQGIPRLRGIQVCFRGVVQSSGGSSSSEPSCASIAARFLRSRQVLHHTYNPPSTITNETPKKTKPLAGDRALSRTSRGGMAS